MLKKAEILAAQQTGSFSYSLYYCGTTLLMNIYRFFCYLMKDNVVSGKYQGLHIKDHGFSKRILDGISVIALNSNLIGSASRNTCYDDSNKHTIRTKK